MAPGTLGLVQYDVKGYLADPFGTLRNLGALFMTGFEQVISISGEEGGGNRRPIAGTEVGAIKVVRSKASHRMRIFHR